MRVRDVWGRELIDVKRKRNKQGDSFLWTVVALATVGVTYNYEGVQGEGAVEEQEHEQEECKGNDFGLIAS